MDSNGFHRLLERSSIDELARIIDWLQRPWEPQRNDRLRAAWHGARRNPRVRSALIAAIEQEIVGMPHTDLEHITRRLGGASPCVDAVWTLITARLSPPPGPSLESAALAILEFAVMLGVGSRHGRRRRHG